MAKTPWTKVGQVLKSKAGGTYIKLDLRKGEEVLKSLTLENGAMLTLQDPRKRKGITEEQLAKIPDFVKADIFLPPAKEE